MLRLLVLTSMALVARGLEMRETVERMVMVRTTGSDLQPAATGYIYKKDNDGPERLVEMGESEVMEHLSKLYAHPHRAASGDASSGERVIPIKEDQHEHVDGIADVDYKKIFDEYSANYGDDRPYSDYLKSLKRFKGALYHKHDGDSAEDDRGPKNHRYGKGDAGNYHNEKFESYSISRDHEKDDGDAHKKHHDHGRYRGYKKFGEDAGKEDDTRGFHSVYDKSDLKDDHEYFGKGVKAFGDEHKYYGTGDRGHKYYHYEPKHHDPKVGHVEGHAEESAEDQGAKDIDTHVATSDATGGAVEPQTEGDQPGGKSYDYKIKH